MAVVKTVWVRITDIERIIASYEWKAEDKQVMNDILSYFKHNVNDKQNTLVEMNGEMFNEYINKLK